MRDSAELKITIIDRKVLTKTDAFSMSLCEALAKAIVWAALAMFIFWLGQAKPFAPDAARASAQEQSQ